MKHEKAEQLKTEVEHTLGSGWKGHVWENINWHVDWKNGAVSLHYSEHTKVNGFWAMVGDIGSGTGNVELTPRDVHHYADPLEAVRKAIEFAQEADVERRQIMLSCAGVLLGLGAIQELEPPVEEWVEYFPANLSRMIAQETDYAAPGPVVVFSGDIQQLDALHCHAEQCNMNSAMLLTGTAFEAVETTLHDFQDGKIDVLFLSLRTFSEGISLTKTSHIIIIDEKPDSVKAQHAIYRAQRLGREGQLTVKHYHLPGYGKL